MDENLEKLLSFTFYNFKNDDKNLNFDDYIKINKDNIAFLIEILDSIPQGIQIVDRNGIIIYVNPTFIKVVKVNLDERLGKNIFDVSPDGSLSTVLKTGKMVLNLMNYPKGTSVELVSSAKPIYYHGKMIGAIAISSDTKDMIDLSTQLLKNKQMIDKLSEKVLYLSTAKYSFDDIIANCSKMRNVIDKSKIAAKVDTTVLIQGETGTGKELVANAIHNDSDRSQKPFVTINCSNIPKDLLESEFFGHEKGSFTGAHKRKLGKFELANNGTLFLDEIGEMNLELQPKILRAIQEQEIQRVGGEDKIKIDVRIITATNRNLIKMIEKGEFRSDLYYRLNAWNIEIPPLRERIEDLECLINFLANKICRRIGKKGVYFSAESLSIMYEYKWPGNVRELENVIERAIIGLKDRDIIEYKDLNYLITDNDESHLDT